MLILASIIISGCQTAATKTNDINSTTSANQLIHQDSTVYFAKRSASISMRSSFINSSSIKQPLADGYKLQFRSIKKGNVLISQVSIVAGGRKITLAEGSFFVPYKKGINLVLSKEDSQFISQYPDAILRFKHEDESYLMRIRSHQISKFAI